MPNEDIITALKNAIDHGDSLESAKQIMINSGYNPAEVQKASNFVGGGVIINHQPTPQEQLTMPNQKKIFGQKTPIPQQTQPQQQTSFQQTTTPTQNQTPVPQQTILPQQLQQTAATQSIQNQVPRTIQQMNQQPPVPQKIQIQPLGKPGTFKNELNQISSKNQGHAREIMLLILLLFLVGVLVTTIVLRTTILSWFSG